MCPNLNHDGFILHNDPWNQNFGTNLNFVVNFCKVSADRENITDSGCVTNSTEHYNYIDGTRVIHKFVRQFFNPFIWMEEKEMEYTADYRT